MGNFRPQKPLNLREYLEKPTFPPGRKLVMLWRWHNSNGSATSIGFPALCPSHGYGGSLVIPWRCLSPSSAAEKNGVRCLRSGVSQPLRQAATTGTRSFLWRQTGLSCLPRAQGSVFTVWREERAVGLARRQPAVHQAVRLPGWPTLSPHPPQGGGRGTLPRLARRQGAG